MNRQTSNIVEDQLDKVFFLCSEIICCFKRKHFVARLLSIVRHNSASTHFTVVFRKKGKSHKKQREEAHEEN